MNLINLFTLIVLCVSQVHSAAVESVAVPVDPFASVQGAKPFAIKLKSDVAAECMESFQAFCKAQQVARDKAAEYKAVESFASNVIRTTTDHPDIHALDGIREWISKPANAGTAYTPAGDRILTVDLDTLTETLNIRAKKPVTAGEISDHIAAASQANGQSRQYSLLRFFAHRILGYQQYELDSLNSWLSGANATTTAFSSSAVLKCDISLMFKLISARAGRDIGSEFGRFVEEYNEKEGRVLLKQDFDAFTMGSGAASSGMSMDFPYETLIENGMETSKQAFPKGFDVSIPLAAAKHAFLRNLSVEYAPESLRIYDRFVIKAQGSGTEHAHERFHEWTKTTITDGLIYQDGDILSSPDTIWALNPHGELRIFPRKKESILGCPTHSYFFQENHIGLPAACAGHMEVRNGKISKIDRSSGHYMPTTLQLVLAVSYLNDLGVIAEDVVLNSSSYSSNFTSLGEVLSIARAVELG